MNCHEPQSYRRNTLRDICKDIVVPETGVVVVGHGTADPVGAAETRKVVAQVDAILPNIPVELGFLEVIEPTIEMALGRLAAQGCKRVVALPILLFSAGHAKQDVPQSLREAATRYGLSVTQADPLGLHELGPQGPLAHALRLHPGRGRSAPHRRATDPRRGVLPRPAQRPGGPHIGPASG